MAASSMEISPSLLKKIRDDPQGVQNEMDRRRGNLSLSDYSASVWSVLEPKRPLIRGPSWDCICEHLEAVGNGEIRRLLINVPPGFSKSLLSNVFFPTYQWGPKNRPDQRFVGFSYSKGLTVRDNRKALLLIQSEAYQRNWGDRFSLSSEAKGRFDTDAQGFKFASSTGGIGTGERGDFVIIDDPNNVKTVESDVIRNETLFWFAEVLPTRLNDPDKSAIVVIQQRTHESDVSGLILSKELGYEWLCLPMEYTPGRRSFTPVRRDGVPRRNVRLVKLQEDSIPTWLDANTEVPVSAEMVGPVRLLTNQDWRRRRGQLVAPERFNRRHLEKDLKPQLRAVGGTYAESGQNTQNSKHPDTVLHKVSFKQAVSLNQPPVFVSNPDPKHFLAWRDSGHNLRKPVEGENYNYSKHNTQDLAQNAVEYFSRPSWSLNGFSSSFFIGEHVPGRFWCLGRLRWRRPFLSACRSFLCDVAAPKHFGNRFGMKDYENNGKQGAGRYADKRIYEKAEKPSTESNPRLRRQGLSEIFSSASQATDPTRVPAGSPASSGGLSPARSPTPTSRSLFLLRLFFLQPSLFGDFHIRARFPHRNGVEPK